MKPDNLIKFIKDLYKSKEVIPLHEPYFDEEEKDSLMNAMDSTFVSSVGPLVNDFENKIAKYTGF